MPLAGLPPAAPGRPPPNHPLERSGDAILRTLSQDEGGPEAPCPRRQSVCPTCAPTTRWHRGARRGRPLRRLSSASRARSSGPSPPLKAAMRVLGGVVPPASGCQATVTAIVTGRWKPEKNLHAARPAVALNAYYHSPSPLAPPRNQ
eukprot:scaffold49160_cov55-Phaeocystis_antarctica.AAC.1